MRLLRLATGTVFAAPLRPVETVLAGSTGKARTRRLLRLDDRDAGVGATALRLALTLARRAILGHVTHDFSSGSTGNTGTNGIGRLGHGGTPGMNGGAVHPGVIGGVIRASFMLFLSVVD
jgi:hypothetical protein